MVKKTIKMDYAQNSNIQSSHIFTWQTTMAKRKN